MNELPWYLSFVATVTCGRPFSCCISSFILMFWWRTVSCKHRSSFCCWRANWTACRSPSLTLLVYSPVKQKNLSFDDGMTTGCRNLTPSFTENMTSTIHHAHDIDVMSWINYREYPCSVCRERSCSACLQFIREHVQSVSIGFIKDIVAFHYVIFTRTTILYWSKNASDAQKFRSQIKE